MNNVHNTEFLNSNILIQADAGPKIGIGHIMRMFAMAQLISKMGFSVHFVSKIEDSQLIELIKKEGFTLYNLKNLDLYENELDQTNFVNICKFLKPKCVIMDGKFVESNTEKILKDLNFKLIRIIDKPYQHLSVDLVINPNLGAEKFCYSLEPFTKTAFGLEYVFLRNEFLIQDCLLANPKNLTKRILVSLGGSNLNTKSAYDVFRRIETLMEGKYEFHIIEGLKTFNLASKMANSDFAFISGGYTMWEALKMNLPFHVITLNDLQRLYLVSTDEYKYWYGTTHFDAVDVFSIEKVIIDYFSNPEIEVDLRKKFVNLRIGDSIHDLIYKFLFPRTFFMFEFLRLKPEHLEMVLNWRTQPHVQIAMLTEVKKNFQNQLNWFKLIQNDDTVFYWIIVLNKKPIGVVNLARVDLVNSRCTAGFYIGDLEYRSFAGLITPYVYNYIFNTLKLKSIYGEVLSSNKSILEIHYKHGFRKIGEIKNIIQKGKVSHDVVIIELCAEDWLRNKRYSKYNAIFE